LLSVILGSSWENSRGSNKSSFLRLPDIFRDRNGNAKEKKKKKKKEKDELEIFGSTFLPSLIYNPVFGRLTSNPIQTRICVFAHRYEERKGRKKRRKKKRTKNVE
jgi:hypothetical protein